MFLYCRYNQQTILPFKYHHYGCNIANESPSESRQTLCICELFEVETRAVGPVSHMTAKLHTQTSCCALPRSQTIRTLNTKATTTTYVVYVEVRCYRALFTQNILADDCIFGRLNSRTKYILSPRRQTSSETWRHELDGQYERTISVLIAK